MLVEAERRGVGEDGAVVAALVGERDLRVGTKSRSTRRRLAFSRRRNRNRAICSVCSTAP